MHDKKRRLEYWRIVRKVQEDNQNNPNIPPKAIVGGKPARKNSSESSSDSFVKPLKPTLIKERFLD